MTAAALILAAVIEIQMTNGVSVADAFNQAAEARASDEQAEIVVNIDLSGKALNRSIFVDGVMQPKGAGKLTIRGVGKKRPRFLGSLPVRGWKKVRDRVNGRTDVWEADVSAFELTGQLDALFMDGKMLTLARYPNFDPKAPYAGGWAYVPGRWISMYQFPDREPSGNRTCMRVGKKDWHNWAVPSEGRIVIYPRQRYGSSYVRIADFDREDHVLRFASNLCDVPRPGDTYILSGYREELDVPGEWCHDLKNGKIYLIPPVGKDPNRCLVTLPTIDCVFEFNGAHNVELQNLEICAARKAVKTQGGSQIVVVGCSIHDIVERAIEFEWGARHRLVDSDVYNLGLGALHITGGSPRDLNGTVIDNCHIHHTGKLDHNGTAIFIEGYGVKVTHCLMHDLPGWAIFHMGGFHELTDNRIHHYMLESEDGAAMYTCSYFGGLCTVIARNWISHGVGIAKSAGWGPLAFFQNCHGLYFDANPSGGPGGTYVYDNAFSHISGMGLKLNSNRCMTITNNVFYKTGNPGLGPWSYAIQFTGGKYDGAKHSDTVRSWQSFRSQRPDLAGLPFFACSPDKTPGNNHSWSNHLERNIWYYPDCPRQQLIIHGGVDFSSHVIDYNLICPGRDAKEPIVQHLNWKTDWQQKLKHDVHSIVVDNINFLAPEKGDFTVRNRSVVKKLGLNPPNLKDCGLYITKFRPKLLPEPDGAARHPEWFKNPVHVNPEPDKRPLPTFSR